MDQVLMDSPRSNALYMKKVIDMRGFTDTADQDSLKKRYNK